MGVQTQFVSKFKYLAFFLIALSISIALVFKAEADVAIFHFVSYVERGTEVTDETGVVQNIKYEHSWTDFEGSVPEGAVVNNIQIHFSWAPVTRSVEEVENTVEDISVENVPEQVPTPDKDESFEEPLTDMNVPDAESDVVDLQQEEQNISDVTENVESASNSELTAPNGTEIPEEETVTEEPVVDPVLPESDTSSETVGFELVSWNRQYLLVNEQIDENVATDTIITPVDVVITESISTTSGFVSPDVVAHDLTEKFFEVRYTTDGVNWYILGKVGFDDAHETVFDLSHIGLELVPNLQIVAEYTLPSTDESKILFDAVQLEVKYGAPIVEEVVEQIGVDERKPNFEISSVKVDVESGNIRALVLERGGVFEFWCSLTDTKTDEVTWSKITGGDAVGPDTPIHIKERTIFWIDRNEQTLFGYAVDTQSLFGTPFQNPDDKSFVLPFQDKNGNAWKVVFNVDLNTFEFQEVPTESP